MCGISWQGFWARAGRDPARDVLTITVNRWPLGYAYEYNTLWDSAILESVNALVP